MKIKAIFFAILFACTVQVMAQIQSANLLENQIIGTWKMVSMTASEQDGKPYTRNIEKEPQYKIITPTHFMFMTYNTDSLRGGGDGGTYTLKGNKYIEMIDGATTDFTVKVEGDKFIQDGVINFADGTTYKLHEVYERVAEPASANSNLVGVWNMTSYTLARDGKKAVEKGLSDLQIYTPTHSIWIDKREGKFWMGMISSYTRQGNKLITKPIIASFPLDSKDKEDVTVTVKGDQLSTVVKVSHSDGKTEDWTMVHQRVGKAKLAKAVSIK